MMNRKGILFSIILSILLMCIPIMAEDVSSFTYSQSNVDVMFVVDYSNSMNSNDQQKVGLQMIEAFIDSSFSKKMRVGFVAYNQYILDAEKPTSLIDKSARDSLKNRLNNIKRSGSTDIGLALKKAESLLSTENAKQSIIILISDGEPDLTYARTGRSINDCYSDMDGVAKNCKEKSIPIYTIAFGENFDGEASCLEELATKTAGTSYLATQPGDLVEIFNTIIEKYTMSKILPIASSLASGELQTVEIPFDNQYISEANVLVISSTPLKEANVLYLGQDVDFSRSQYYFTCKIDEPQNEMVKLQYKADKGETIKVYLLLYHGLDFKVDLPKKVSKNNEAHLKAYFIDHTNNQVITDETIYNRYKIDASLSDADNNIYPVVVNFQDGKLIGNINLNHTGIYHMKYALKDSCHSLNFDDIQVECVNDGPVGGFELNRSYPVSQKEMIFNLDDYFSDPNQDRLVYRIDSLEGKGALCEIKDNELMITPSKLGKVSFNIIAMDSEQKELASQASTVSVLPLWRYYLKMTLIVAAIVIVLGVIVAYYFIKKRLAQPKPVYSGKINVYFTQTPEEIEIEPLTFSFFQMSPQRICFNTLLEGAGYKVESLDAEHIYFEPGFNREIVFHHESKSAVMIGSSIACRKLKYSIAYGTKIYITSPDESYDLEIHFVSARS